ncbi:hypothetical protein Q2941_49650 [Bradyrhizobium sp. UFLA05-153]
MKDMLAHLQTLRLQICECERLQQEAKSRIKRDVFARIVANYRLAADDLERAIAAQAKEE